MTKTASPKDALKHNALKGMFWSALDALFRLGFQFGITVALARLLTPTEFGIVALVYVFTQVGSMLVTAGFGAVLVRQRDLDEELISTIFHFQWVTALIFGLSLGLMSPWIAGFYGSQFSSPLFGRWRSLVSSALWVWCRGLCFPGL